MLVRGEQVDNIQSVLERCRHVDCMDYNCVTWHAAQANYMCLRTAPATPAISAEQMQQQHDLELLMAKTQQERAALSRMRTELEKAAVRLEQERNAWERQKVSQVVPQGTSKLSAMP